jgi:hypothetical protein
LGVGLALLLITCINYVNLATARTAKRARALGLRKILGASRVSLVASLLGESVFFALLAKDGTRKRRDYPNELTALDLIGRLLDAGADPNKPYTGQMHSTSMCCDTFENGSPFFRAAIAADVAALQLLLDHGGDIEWSPAKSDRSSGPGANGNVGKTPLMVAMNGGKGVGMAGGPGDIREGTKPPFREEANREPADAVQLLLEAG